MLFQLLLNLFTEETVFKLNGIGYAGTVNIESAGFEIKTRHFAPCDDCDFSNNLVVNCQTCGRQSGNNLRFLSGRGDGVYSGVSLHSENEFAGAIYVFDENNAMAESFSRQYDGHSSRNVNVQDLLIEGIREYSDTQAFYAGDISSSVHQDKNGDLGLVVGDVFSGGAGYATVDHIFADGEYSVYLFMEPILESLTVSLSLRMEGDSLPYDRGYADAMRPRVALVVKKQFESTMLDAIETKDVDWSQQCLVWSETQVFSNIGNHGSDGTANFVNGLFWLGTSADQIALNNAHDFNDDMANLYRSLALGYFLAGALQGNQDCFEAFEGLVDAEGIKVLEDVELVNEILAPRGLAVTNEVIALFERSSSLERDKFDLTKICTFCGSTVVSGSRFCSNCGKSVGLN